MLEKEDITRDSPPSSDADPYEFQAAKLNWREWILWYIFSRRLLYRLDVAFGWPWWIAMFRCLMTGPRLVYPPWIRRTMRLEREAKTKEG